MPAGRCCSKAGSTGRRCRFRQRTWILPSRKRAPRARSRSPSACRRCCLGLPGDNTFSNYAEANRAFWRQTVLPLVARVQKSFQAWLQPGFGSFRLDYNADRLEALASERAAEWERVGKAAFLTLDEQREAVGYGPAPKEALFAKRDAALERRYSPDQPRVPAGIFGGGQWTNGGAAEISGGGSSGARDDRARRPTCRDCAEHRSESGERRRRVHHTGPGARPEAEADVSAGPGEATPSQLDRLEDTARLAREAETRAGEIDPRWKPEPTLIDPKQHRGVASTATKAHTRQANARYSEHSRELYGDLALPGRDSAPRGDLTGPRALVRRQDDSETRRGAERENQIRRHSLAQRPQCRTRCRMFPGRNDPIIGSTARCLTITPR